MENWKGNDEFEEASRIFNIAIGHEFKGDYLKALGYYEKSLKIR
jgi:hypothetical protein